MADEVDIIIIGAGVIGLAIASRIARRNRDVIILEKNASFGRESSSRNSGTIHSGALNPPGSLNARFCLEGRRIIYDICREYGVAYLKCGKLLVGNDSQELAGLETVYRRRSEDIPMTRLSGDEVQELEPDIRARAAILLPESGVVDIYGLMSCYLRLARDNGASLICNSEVIGIEKMDAGYLVKVREPYGIAELKCRILVNCAGLQSAKIAAMAGIDVDKSGYKLRYLKGEYYNGSRKIKRMDRRLIYPMRRGNMLRIHTVLDIDGTVRLGPYFYPVDEISYTIDDSHKQAFSDELRGTFPLVEYDEIEPESAGVMPRLYGIDEKFKEFIVRHEADKGLPGLINLIGIETPGITASPAIARYVGGMIDEILG